MTDKLNRCSCSRYHLVVRYTSSYLHDIMQHFSIYDLFSCNVASSTQFYNVSILYTGIPITYSRQALFLQGIEGPFGPKGESVSSTKSYSLPVYKQSTK